MQMINHKVTLGQTAQTIILNDGKPLSVTAYAEDGSPVPSACLERLDLNWSLSQNSGDLTAVRFENKEGQQEGSPPVSI